MRYVDSDKSGAYTDGMLTAEEQRPASLPDGSHVPLGSLDPKYWLED